MRNKKKERRKSKSLNLAFYFSGVVILIITISILLKSFDVIRRSRFDGNNRFTVAILSNGKTDLVSVSPQEGSLTSLQIDASSNLVSLGNLSFPIDAYAKTDSSFTSKTKYFFFKILLNKRKMQTNLTTIDLLRLSIYAMSVNEERVKEGNVPPKDVNKLSLLSSTLFVDPVILEEKVSIQITNATEVSGLGNKLAKYITNMGGNVVLVNSSKDLKEKSEVMYARNSYTVKKFMKFFDIPGQKKNMNSISDIVIVVGKDRAGL